MKAMKKYMLYMFPVMAAMMSCGGGGTAETAATAQPTPAEELRVRLDSIGRHGFAFGMHDATAYGHTWVGLEDSCDVHSVCGDYPGVMNWDLGLIEWNCDKELDGVPFNVIRCEVAKQDRRGGINTFSWHVRNPQSRGDSWNCEGDSVVRQCVTAGNPLNDTIKVWIGRAADFIGSLRDDEGNRIGVVFRPWHEHTGSWFWWGQDHCSADDYKALWQLTYDIFKEKGIDNVLWAYSPDKDNVTDVASYLERYPGDSIIDIMGGDVYHFDGAAGKDTYLERVRNVIGSACIAARERGKLAAFTETGSEGLPMADWWTSVLLDNIKEYPICYVSVWRNAHDNPKHFYAPYPGQESVPSFIEFYNDDRTLFARDLEKIK